MSLRVVETETELLAIPDTAQPFEQERQTLESQAQLVVIDQPSFERAAELRRTLKLFVQRVKAEFDPVVAAAYEAHRKAVALRKRFLDPAEQAEKILKGRMDGYERDVEAERQRQAAAAEQERQRLEQAALEQTAQLTRALEDDAAAEQLAEALAAEEDGDPARAAQILAQPLGTPVITPPVVYVPPVTLVAPSAPGVTYSTTWKFELTSLMELVRAVAAGRVPLMVTLPNGKAVPIFEANQQWLDAQARAQKSALRIPGGRAVAVRTSSVSTR